MQLTDIKGAEAKLQDVFGMFSQMNQRLDHTLDKMRQRFQMLSPTYKKSFKYSNERSNCPYKQSAVEHMKQFSSVKASEINLPTIPSKRKSVQVYNTPIPAKTKLMHLRNHIRSNFDAPTSKN